MKDGEKKHGRKIDFDLWTRKAFVAMIKWPTGVENQLK